MRYPEFLKINGTIGFAAPSFGCATEPYRSAFDSALEKFNSMGYNTKLGDNCYKACGIGISNTPKLCALELQTMYEALDNDVLISCGGGELMCEILPYLDFKALSNAKPKWYMGYSDNTNFTFLQTTLTDTASIYAPCAGAFGMKEWHKAIKDAFGVLTGASSVYDENTATISIKSYDLWEKDSLKSEENPTAPYNLTETVELKSYCGNNPVNKVKLEGRLLGGCMDCLVNLTGTKFDKVAEFNEKYADDGIIWFLESCDLNVLSIRRAMWHMEQAGWFEKTKGFLIGRPLVFGEELMGLDQYEAVLGVIGKYNVPVVMDINIGHLPPSMPIICGSKAVVDVNGNDMNLSMKLI